MKKFLLIVSFTVVTASALGMKERGICDKGSYSEAHLRETSDQYHAETSSSSKKKFRDDTIDQRQSKKRKTSDTEAEIDEDTIKMIADYAKRMVECKKGKPASRYSEALIKESLMYYCIYPKVKVEDIALKFGVVSSTFEQWISAAKISRRNSRVSKEQLKGAVKEYIRNGGSRSRAARKFGIEMKTLGNEIKKRSDQGLMLKAMSTIGEFAEMKQQIADSYHNGGDFKDFYDIFKRNTNNAGEIPEGLNYTEFANNQEMGNYTENYVKKVFRDLIIPTWSEEDKVRLLNRYAELIKDVREGYLSQKGRLKKYGLRECEDYLVCHIARERRDISVIKKIKWDIVYKGTSLMPEETKEQIIKDYNSGLFTARGIAEKNQTTEAMVFYVTSGLRDGVKNISIDDIVTKSAEYIKEKYNAAVDTVRRYKSQVTQWYNLNDDQKNIFKDTMKTLKMPSEDDLNRIKDPELGEYGETERDATKKLKKVLTVMCAKDNKEIAEKLGLKSTRSVPHQRKVVEIWKLLATYEENLIEASKNGEVKVVENLINKNTDVNCKDEKGLTPLHHAVKIQSESLVKLLVKSGANVNEKNKNGNTPLMFAVGVKNKRLVRYLINKRADVNKRNKNGQTALYMADRLKLDEIVGVLRQALRK